MNAIRAFFRDLTLRPQGVTVVIAAFLPIIAIVAMGPAVPTMIQHFIDDPDARRDVPAMIGAPGLAMALLAPFAGLLVDRFGRRRLLLISTLFYGVFGAAPLLLDNLDQIYVSRLLLGVSEAGILTVVNTLIGDYWDDKGRKNWLFLQGILGPFIAGIVSLIVGYASHLQWNGVFYVYLIAFPIWAAMFVYLFEPDKAVAQDRPGARADPTRRRGLSGRPRTAGRRRHPVRLDAVLRVHHQRCARLRRDRRDRTRALRPADLSAEPMHPARLGPVQVAGEPRQSPPTRHVPRPDGDRPERDRARAERERHGSVSRRSADRRRHDRAHADRVDPVKVRICPPRARDGNLDRGVLPRPVAIAPPRPRPRRSARLDAGRVSARRNRRRGGGSLRSDLETRWRKGRDMKLASALLPLALMGATAAAAQETVVLQFSDAARADYPGEIKLGTGPGQPREDWFRESGSLQVRNVSEATITPFLPPAGAGTGAAVIVAPGGAFLGLAIEEEGYRIARWLAEHGIAAFVLKYRVLPTPNDPAVFRREVAALRNGGKIPSFRPPEDTPPQALEDGLAAMRLVRADAAKWGVDPARVGMMGFSAGAFTTLSVTSAAGPDAMPAFIAPIYGRFVERPVPANAPPLFAVIAADDGLFAKQGFGLVESWLAAGKPAEFHLYQSGGHGFGLGRAGTTTTDWIEGFHRWLAANGFLTRRK